MISLVIASPSPVPPSLNVTNGVKISFSCDSGMPHPLSVMTICTLWSLEKAHNFTFPSALEIASAAFLSRFSKACFNLTGSIKRAGSEGDRLPLPARAAHPAPDRLLQRAEPAVCRRKNV